MEKQFFDYPDRSHYREKGKLVRHLYSCLLLAFALLTVSLTLSFWFPQFQLVYQAAGTAGTHDSEMEQQQTKAQKPADQHQWWQLLTKLRNLQESESTSSDSSNKNSGPWIENILMFTIWAVIWIYLWLYSLRCPCPCWDFTKEEPFTEAGRARPVAFCDMLVKDEYWLLGFGKYAVVVPNQSKHSHGKKHKKEKKEKKDKQYSNNSWEEFGDSKNNWEYNSELHNEDSTNWEDQGWNENENEYSNTNSNNETSKQNPDEQQLKKASKLSNQHILCIKDKTYQEWLDNLSLLQIKGQKISPDNPSKQYYTEGIYNSAIFPYPESVNELVDIPIPIFGDQKNQEEEAVQLLQLSGWYWYGGEWRRPWKSEEWMRQVQQKWVGETLISWQQNGQEAQTGEKTENSNTNTTKQLPQMYLACVQIPTLKEVMKLIYKESGIYVDEYDQSWKFDHAALQKLQKKLDPSNCGYIKWSYTGVKHVAWLHGNYKYGHGTTATEPGISVPQLVEQVISKWCSLETKRRAKPNARERREKQEIAQGKEGSSGGGRSNVVGKDQLLMGSNV